MKNSQKGSISVKIIIFLIIIIAALYSFTFVAHAAGTGTVNVITNVINDDNGVNDPSFFTVHVDGANATPNSFPGSNNGVAVTVDAKSSYDIYVVPGFFYTATLSPDCAGQIVENDAVTCTITLNDISQPAGGSNTPNLILNPSLETPSAGNPNIPENWFQGFNDPASVVTYTYPVTDAPDSEISSGNAAKIDVTSLVAGSDAKWYFAPVPVQAGRQYSFKNAYISDVGTDLVADFFDNLNNHISYSFVGAPSTPVATWVAGSATFVPPAGAASMTVYHRISNPGSLTIDSYSLMEVPLPIPFSKGFVSLTFDDGFDSHYNTVKPILDARGMKGTFYAVSHFVKGLSVENSSLETADPVNAGNPLAWLKAGSVGASFTYPEFGQSGNGAKVSAGTEGSNAGWYFEPIKILPDTVYAFSSDYNSNTDTEIIAQITTVGGKTGIANVVDVNGVFLGSSITLSSSENSWAHVEGYFFLPPEAKYVTILHRLKGAGDLTIDNTEFGARGYMNKEQILNLQSDAQDIGSHTETHASLTSISLEDARAEVVGSRNDLVNGGVLNVKSFNYPYGDFNRDVQQIVRDAGFSSGRTVIPGVNGKNTDKFALFAKSVNADTTIAQVQAWIDEAKANRSWLVLVFHDISDDLNGSPYGATPATLQAIVSYLASQDVPVKTIAEGVNMMGTPTLNVVVNVNNSATGTVNPSDFTINVTGINVIPDTFTGSTTPTAVNLDPGAYSVVNTTAIPTGYTSVTQGDCSGNISYDENKTCTITISADVIPPAGGGNGGGNGGGGGGSSGGGSSSGSSGFTNPSIPSNSTSTTAATTTPQVLGATTFKFLKNLSFGMRNTDVNELQKRLTSEGVYKGPVTGYFGSLTEVGVKAYQAKNNIEQVGLVGPKTRAKLNGDMTGTSTTSIATDPKVLLLQLQAQLAELQAKLASTTSAN